MNGLSLSQSIPNSPPYASHILCSWIYSTMFPWVVSLYVYIRNLILDELLFLCPLCDVVVAYYKMIVIWRTNMALLLLLNPCDRFLLRRYERLASINHHPSAIERQATDVDYRAWNTWRIRMPGTFGPSLKACQCKTPSSRISLSTRREI